MPIEPPKEVFAPTPAQRKRAAEGLTEFADIKRRLAAGERPTAAPMPEGKADAPLGIEGED
jgi:hypothetical protein